MNSVLHREDELMRRTTAFHWTDLIVVPLALLIAWSKTEGAPRDVPGPLILAQDMPTPHVLAWPSSHPRTMLIPTQWTARPMPIPTQWDARPMLVAVEAGSGAAPRRP
jgi:hypothetical protein